MQNSRFLIARSLTGVYLNALICHLGYYALLPLLIVTLLLDKQISRPGAAVLFLLFILAYRGTRFISAQLVETVPPKHSVVTSSLLAGISLLFAQFAEHLFPLALSLFVAGFCFAVRGMAGRLCISNIGSQDGNSKAYFARLGQFFNASTVVGPLLSALLLLLHQRSHVFFVAGLFYVASALVAQLRIDRATTTVTAAMPSGSRFQNWTAALRESGFRTFLLLNALGWFFYSQLFTSIAVSAYQSFHVHLQLGFLFALNGLAVVLLHKGVERWTVEKLGRQIQTKLAFLYGLFALTFLLVACSSALWSIYLAVLLFTFAEMIFAPSVDLMVGIFHNPARRATDLSLLGLSTLLGEGFGGFVGLNGVGLGSTFWLLIALASLAIAIFSLTLRKQKTNDQEDFR